MVKEVTYYVHEDFAQGTYDSCKGVVNPATSGSALNFLCGPWGSTLCTAHRWFEYMGSTSNGYSPFNILYEFLDQDSDPMPDGFEPHNPDVVPCHIGVGVSESFSQSFVPYSGALNMRI